MRKKVVSSIIIIVLIAGAVTFGIVRHNQHNKQVKAQAVAAAKAQARQKQLADWEAKVRQWKTTQPTATPMPTATANQPTNAKTKTTSSSAAQPAPGELPNTGLDLPFAGAITVGGLATAGFYAVRFRRAGFNA